MSEKRYVFPEGMLRAAWEAMDKHANWHKFAGCIPGSMCSLTDGLEAAVRWLAENPIVPTAKQSAELEHLCRLNDEPTCSDATFYCAEWQRLCFLAPEPEVTEAVKDLLSKYQSKGYCDNFDIIEAYRRGQKSK